jgi:steroid 5-alpha reductase family enzyme
LPQIRIWFPGLKYELFTLVFVHFFQLTEILAFSLAVVPAYYSAEPLGPLDWAAAALYLGLVAGEATADAQMFAFQKEKVGAKRKTERASFDTLLPNTRTLL